VYKNVGRYWTVDPKSDKMEALAVPTALQDSLVAHSGSLATASVLFTLAAPLQVRLHDHDTSAALQEKTKKKLRLSAIITGAS